MSHALYEGDMREGFIRTVETSCSAVGVYSTYSVRVSVRGYTRTVVLVKRAHQSSSIYRFLGAGHNITSICTNITIWRCIY